MRHKPSVWKKILLKSAIEVARNPGGWSTMTRKTVAKNAGCSDAMVNLHIGDMPTLRKIVMRYAIRYEVTEIIVQSLAAHDGYVRIPTALKQKALASLLG